MLIGSFERRETSTPCSYLAKNGAAQLRLDEQGLEHLALHIPAVGRTDLLIDLSVERRDRAWVDFVRGRETDERQTSPSRRHALATANEAFESGGSQTRGGDFSLYSRARSPRRSRVTKYYTYIRISVVPLNVNWTYAFLCKRT